MNVLADVGTAAGGMEVLFGFLAPFALGLGLGLLAAIFELARKPTVRAGLWLVTGVLQLVSVGACYVAGGLIFNFCTSSIAQVLFLPGSFMLGTLAMLGPALAIRDDRRHRPKGGKVHVERSQEVQAKRSIIEAFRQLSQRIDGRLDEEALCVTAESELGRAMVEVESFEGGGDRSYFSMEFAQPLLFELDITDRSPHHRPELRTHPDIEVGDERFDHDFVVRGAPAASVRSALDADTRGAIEALSGLTHGISVDRESASTVMVGLVLDPDQAEGIVRALEAVARALTLQGSDPGA